MKKQQKDQLIRIAGKDKYGNPQYKNQDAPEKVIRYITRTNGKPADDLMAWGGVGITEYSGMENIIGQFYRIQEGYTRKGNFGRYIDHEIFSLSDTHTKLALENNLDMDKIARKMAYDIYDRDNCQVVYGVHAPTSAEKHLHIHFAVNTVNHKTKRKRHENMQKTAEREARYIKILHEEICQQMK